LTSRFIEVTHHSVQVYSCTYAICYALDFTSPASSKECPQILLIWVISHSPKTTSLEHQSVKVGSDIVGDNAYRKRR
jgi:hypothetical protein